MPTFPANTEFLAEVNGDPLELPLRGQVFRFPGSPSMTEAPVLREIQRKMFAQARGEIPADTVVVPQQQDFYDGLLGDQIPLMVEAGVTEAEKDHLALTVLMYYLQGTEAAQRHWTGELARQAKEAAQEKLVPTEKKKAPPKARKSTTQN